MADVASTTLTALGSAAVMLVLLLAVTWIWGLLLDRYEHDPARVRSVMFAIWVLLSLHELWLGLHVATGCWVAWVATLANLWGGLDAVLRFPGSHEAESLFLLKQQLLLVTKTLAYSIDLAAIGGHLALLAFILVFHVWMPALLYFMALPMDPAERVLRDDSYDVDLLVRVWQLAACPAERRSCLATCDSFWRRRLAVPRTSFLLGGGGPRPFGELRHRGRSV